MKSFFTAGHYSHGTEHIIADSAAPIKDKNNKIIGAILVFRDITEKQKLIETSLRNQKLESLGILAGGIAHDFNNLMGGIFGYIDLAIEESKDGMVTQYLSKAIATMDRARSLTQQLLTFAKGGAPIQKITPLTPLIPETAQFALSGSNVSYRDNMAKDLWPCLIDKNQICQVIDNIIINAQQAMPAGGTVEISASNVCIGENEHLVLRKGNYVKVAIKDHGIGISKKMTSTIFDPYFTTKPTGHGLGLATSYSIVHRHGGVIDVESVLDEGSTFFIYLPASPEPVISDTSSNTEHKGSGRIIIMDDEEAMRETIGTMLETLGYSVVCKSDGKSVVDFFIEETKAERVITALILDLTIPGGMGGKEVIKEIRKLNPDIPVFVASGYAEDMVMKNPADYGFTASISKPFRKTDLSNMLNKYITVENNNNLNATPVLLCKVVQKNTGSEE